MTQLRRRQVLLGGATLAAAATTPLLAGCGSGASGSTGSNAPGEAAPLPTFRAQDASPKADLPGTPGVLPDTYFRYPDDPPALVTAPPGDGRPIGVLTQTFAPITPAVGQNSVWSNLNEALGSPLEIQQVPAADYVTKFATVVAGDQLPDLFYVSAPPPPRLPELMRSRALDLTDHLSGDAVLAYPNLANLPTACWEAGRFGGRLYGLPSPRGAMSSGVQYRRDDLLAAKGITADVQSFQDFYDLCEELNDPRGGVWALTLPPTQFIRTMLSIPNEWRQTDGGLQSALRAPEQLEALEATRKIVAAELVNPDAFAAPNSKTWFSAGQAYFNQDSFTAWAQYYGGAELPDGFDIGVFDVPAFAGGGQGSMWLSYPSFGVSAISAKAADRVDTLLKVADYLAAPFGSQEYLTVRYGVEGEDYELTGGNPVPTSSGSANRELGVKYIVDAPVVNYIPGRQDAAEKLIGSLAGLVENASANDAVYLYSETQSSKGPASAKKFEALQNDILQGRQPVEAWSAAVEDWWKAEGEQTTAELNQAYEESGRG